ncbi:hypothetical protein PN36_33775 [Candidatus Thiomargarita nelsonii]|uniref:DUF898 domain-containing protein n=1 Tax=Candidatus Thiomargarita nelsonii TaxID=1003181 RepID=A0A0A6PAZ6_9GAMM|nr:hypothetical protein PN36_33775 [Candidatus Thiomargarita nelsonii]
MTEQQPQTLPFMFSGEGGEYFKIWIVNLILSVLTLGIYSAWAKVRTNRYFYGNTSLDNAAFEYHATPMVILKGRLIAVAALVIYLLLSEFFPIAGLLFTAILGLLIPWVIWRSIQFNARMVSYRNVRFGFQGLLKEPYKILVLTPLLPIIIGSILGGIAFFVLGKGPVVSIISSITILAVGLIYPYIKMLLASYYINNRQYGQGQFSAQFSAMKYYMIYFGLIAWTLLFVIIIFFIMQLTGGIALTPAMGQGEAIGKIAGMMLLFYIIFFALSLWGTAYLEANVKNYLLNKTKLDDVLQLNSDIKVSKLLGIYVTNTLLVGITFGLAYPWAIVRLKKYKIESTSATIKADIAQYANQQQKAQSALGEEMGDAFDAELDLGI